MTRVKKFILIGLAVVVALTLIAVPVFADVGLKVEGAIAEINAQPGNIYIHKMMVKSYDNYPDMEVDVKAYGLGQKLDGGYEALNGTTADNQFSAFNYITKIENMSFFLPSGGEQEVMATIDIPPTENIQGGRYAVLHIKPTLENTHSFVFIPSIFVPVVLNFGSWELSGEITDVAMGNTVSGKPIECLVTMHNTGNYHYRANCTAILKNAADEVVNESISSYTTVSLIPGYSYLFNVEINPQQGALPQGAYNITCVTSLEDGTVLDTQTISFDMEQNYIRFLDEQNEFPYTMNWAFIGGTLVLIMAGAFIIFMLMRRRRSY